MNTPTADKLSPCCGARIEEWNDGTKHCAECGKRV
jgi:hypothetical protein